MRRYAGILALDPLILPLGALDLRGRAPYRRLVSVTGHAPGMRAVKEPNDQDLLGIRGVRERIALKCSTPSWAEGSLTVFAPIMIQSDVLGSGLLCSRC